jgi:hypothetical protein
MNTDWTSNELLERGTRVEVLDDGREGTITGFGWLDHGNGPQYVYLVTFDSVRDGTEAIIPQYLSVVDAIEAAA